VLFRIVHATFYVHNVIERVVLNTDHVLSVRLYEKDVLQILLFALMVGHSDIVRLKIQAHHELRAVVLLDVDRLHAIPAANLQHTLALERRQRMQACLGEVLLCFKKVLAFLLEVRKVQHVIRAKGSLVHGVHNSVVVRSVEHSLEHVPEIYCWNLINGRQ